MGCIRKACAPRHGKVSDADMRTNADIADRLAKSYSFEELLQAVAGRRARIERGEIPSMPPGCAWSLRVYWDKDPIRNQIDQDLGAYHATSPPGPPSEDQRGGMASVGELMDFTRFARS